MVNDLKSSKFCGEFLQFTVTNPRVSNFWRPPHPPKKKTKQKNDGTNHNQSLFWTSKNPIQIFPPRKVDDDRHSHVLVYHGPWPYISHRTWEWLASHPSTFTMRCILPSPTSKEPFNVATINGVMPSNALLKVFRLPLLAPHTHTYLMLTPNVGMLLSFWRVSIYVYMYRCSVYVMENQKYHLYIIYIYIHLVYLQMGGFKIDT